MPVIKSEIVERMARDADISKAAATRALESYLSLVRITLRKGGAIQHTGFGTFEVRKVAARVGRNPRNGDVIKLKAHRTVRFRPSPVLKKSIN